MLLSSSEKVPGLHTLHSVSPLGPHSRTAPSPREHCEQGAHMPYVSKKKKPSSHSHCVFWEAEQAASVGMPAGHLEQGEHWPRPSDEEKVPGGESTRLRRLLLGGMCLSRHNGFLQVWLLEKLLTADGDQDERSSVQKLEIFQKKPRHQVATS